MKYIANTRSIVQDLVATSLWAVYLSPVKLLP